jgi:pimeloyl-ACP methyl ester carboxylesterase
MVLQETPEMAQRFAYLDDQQRAFTIHADAAFLREEIISSSNGAPLTVYEAGAAHSPVVVLINPLGMSCLFMTRLALRLAEHFRVISWESRGLPDYAAVQPDGKEDWSLESHCQDLLAILRHKQCEMEAIVSFCSGANIAVHGLSNGLLKTQRLCMVSPSLEMGEVGGKTDYQRGILPLWSKIAQDGLRMATLVRVLLQQSESKFDSNTDYELSVINNLPFKSNEHTLRYAQLHTPCLQQHSTTLLPRIAVPTLLIHGEDDDMVHADSARAIAAALPQCELLWNNEGGHFAIYKSTTLQTAVARFLLSPASDNAVALTAHAAA